MAHWAFRVNLILVLILSYYRGPILHGVKYDPVGSPGLSTYDVVMVFNQLFLVYETMMIQCMYMNSHTL